MLTIHHRPSCCRGRGLLLAQDLLGLVDDKSGSRRQADPDTAVGQPGHGLHHAGLGVAAGVPRRLGLPPQPRDPPRHPALATLASVLLYQGSNAAMYYVAAMIIYFWAYSEGEVSTKPPFGLFVEAHGKLTGPQIIGAKPWTLPQRGSRLPAGKV